MRTYYLHPEAAVTSAPRRTGHALTGALVDKSNG